MAAVFVVLAVYAALGRAHAGWSAAALAFGLLSKENAAVAPALVVWAWMLGLDRPDRRRMVALVVGWVVVGAAYAAVRTLVRQPFGGYGSIAPMFIGQSPLAVRLTAVAALADVVRLLVFPLTLRVDYSPNERTAVTTPLDLRFAIGLLCALTWAALLLVAWKRGRKLEAFGLGWIGVSLRRHWRRSASRRASCPATPGSTRSALWQRSPWATRARPIRCSPGSSASAPAPAPPATIATRRRWRGPTAIRGRPIPCWPARSVWGPRDLQGAALRSARRLAKIPTLPIVAGRTKSSF